MSIQALHLIRMDVAHDYAVAFEQAYDREHFRRLQGVSGVRRASRYRQPSPTEPRHMIACELDGPRVVDSAAWQAADAFGCNAVQPYALNRHVALYEWVGGNAALIGETPYVFWVMMDVEPHREALFNELYDTEHLPLLFKLPGCANAVRYRTSAAGEPRYLCAYEVESADLPMSKRWNDASDIGRWKPEVRPYTYNKKWIVSERV